MEPPKSSSILRKSSNIRKPIRCVKFTKAVVRHADIRDQKYIAWTALWRIPFFTELTDASSFEVILAGQSKHSSTGTLASGTSGSRCISLILPRGRARRRLRLCQISTLIHIVAETAIVSFHTLPVGFPLPTISKNSLYTLLCSLIRDYVVLPIIFVSDAKILISNILLDTSFHYRLQSVIIRSYHLLMNLHIVQFQYGLEFLRLVFLICTILPRCHQVESLSLIIEFRPISNRIPEYHRFEEQL